MEKSPSKIEGPEVYRMGNVAMWHTKSREKSATIQSQNGFSLRNAHLAFAHQICPQGCARVGMSIGHRWKWRQGWKNRTFPTLRLKHACGKGCCPSNTPAAAQDVSSGCWKAVINTRSRNSFLSSSSPCQPALQSQGELSCWGSAPWPAPWWRQRVSSLLASRHHPELQRRAIPRAVLPLEVAARRKEFKCSRARQRAADCQTWHQQGISLFKS